MGGADLKMVNAEGKEVVVFEDNQNKMSDKPGKLEILAPMNEVLLDWTVAGGLSLAMVLQVKRSGGKTMAIAPPPM